ncbi:MAG: hypothetical protein JO288_16080 [Hyphomicrobiales bacterium]|nr:hypothetical protein [Hyphomicrobiales bacterium]
MAADGDWKLVINTPMGPQEADLSVRTKTAATFDGVLNGQSGRQEFEGQIAGDTLIWQTDITTPMPLTLDFNVTIDGDALSGQVQLGMFGPAAVTGARA